MRRPVASLLELAARAPEQPEPRHRHRIHGDVKGAVGEDLDFDPAKVLAGRKAQQMVPLQHLVQQDAVEEAAKGHSQHKSGGPQPASAATRASRRDGHSRGVPPVTG
jgi:hypothetical protein